MPDLTVLTSPIGQLDEKHRVFAEQVAHHGDPLKALIAARIANPAYTRQIMAQQLMADPKIQAAIEAFRQVKPKKRQVRMTRDAILEDIEEVYEKAMGKEDFTNALKAKQEQAQLLGLRVEKKEVTVTTTPEEMSTTDLKKAVNQLLRQQQEEARTIDITPERVDG